MKKGRVMIRNRLFTAAVASVALIACLASFSCAGMRRGAAVRNALKAWKGDYVLLASKADFKLYVYDRRGAVTASYRMSYGLNPDKKAKIHEGDNRTPEGTYCVVEILSMDADARSDACRKLKKMNEIFFRAAEGHSKYGRPGVDLGDNAYGPRFMLLDYPRPADMERYGKELRSGRIPVAKGKTCGPGGGIAIHGNNDEASVGNLSSSGCLRLYNNDVIELEKFVRIGTPVIISAY
jgi:hypothetical protein